MLDPALLSPFGFAAVGYELPGEPVDIIDYARDQGVDPALLERLLANRVRYFYDGTDRSDADMAGGAVEAICAERGSSWLKEVSYVIHARTQTFSMPPPPTSIITQVCSAFGIQPKLAFGIEQVACSGVVRAIDWACRLLTNDPDARYVLIITSDRVFGNAQYRIRQDAGVQCDAGTAMLVAREDLICRFGPITTKTFAGHYEGPSTDALAAAIGYYTPVQTKESFVHHARACGVDIGDFARLLPINADRHYWLKIADYLGVPPDMFFLDNITQRGHACCGDLAINVADGGLAAIRAGGSIVYCGQSNLGVYANITFCPPTPATFVTERPKILETVA